MPEPLTAVARPLRPTGGPVELEGASAAVVRMREFMRRAASADSNVLIVAEEGSWPDALARNLHERDPQHGRPFIEVDCGDPHVPHLARALFCPPRSHDPTSTLTSLPNLQY